MESLTARCAELLDILEKTYPNARIALNYGNPLELLVATVLSALCTDVRVNQVTPALFRKYSSARDYAEADLGELEEAIRSAGFYRNKARALIAAARILVEEFNGEVPRTMEELTALPGVGRKTANVILGNAYGVPAMAVATHVKRVSYRLGWTRHIDPVKIESDLCAILPPVRWTHASHLLIWHGRGICKALTPLCSMCTVAHLCPRAGVKRSR